MALYYADSSALVKLVANEPETQVLRTFIEGADLVSCELALAEVPRAVRRAAAENPKLALDTALTRANELLDSLGLRPVDRQLIIEAGSLEGPALRTLDAIHISAAINLQPIDGFVSYDERQAATARLAGLRTFSPGV